MRKIAITLNILLALSTMAFAQTENNSEVMEFKLNDFYFAKFRQISEDNYADRKKESEHLCHKPYKVVSDISEVQKILGKKLKVFDIKEKGADFGYREYEISFKDGTKKRLDADYGFVAYFPQLEILLFEGGHGGDYPFDLNNSNKSVSWTDFPHSITIGNPYYHTISPDKQLKINGFFGGQDCTFYFLEKWNKSNKKYELVGWFWSEEHNFISNFCYANNWFWISNCKALFKNSSGGDWLYYEIEFIENACR